MEQFKWEILRKTQPKTPSGLMVMALYWTMKHEVKQEPVPTSPIYRRSTLLTRLLATAASFFHRKFT